MSDELPKKRFQTSTDRDLAALEKRHRAASHHDTDQDPVLGVASGEFESSTPPEVHDEITKPHDVAVMRRYSTDAAYRILWDRLGEFKQQVRHTQGIIADQTMATHQAAAQGAGAAMAERIDEMEEWMHRQDTMMRIIKWVAVALTTALLASVITMGTKVFTWGQSDGENTIRMQRLERDVQTLQQRLLDQQHRDNQPPAWLQQFQPKGTQP